MNELEPHVSKKPQSSNEMKVLLLSRYDTLPAPSRYRFYQYLPFLRANGIHVTVAPLLDNQFAKRHYTERRKPLIAVPKLYAKRIVRLLQASQFDLVWLEKEALPWIPAWVEKVLGLNRVPYLVDYDDALFVTYNEQQPSLVRYFLGDKVRDLMRGAAVVIAGNRYLALYAREAGAARVDILPSVVDIHRYPSRSKSEREMFTIGWMGAPMNSKHLGAIGSALSSICAAGNAKINIVGGWPVEFPSGLTVEYLPWSESTEIQHLQSFDVGIMPLNDGPWEQGKCGLKLVQYMAAGLPVVASPVGVNKEIVEHGVNGFLASTIPEWETALATLRDDPTLRERMGIAGRVKVEREYCLQVTAPRLVNLLRSARTLPAGSGAS